MNFHGRHPWHRLLPVLLSLVLAGCGGSEETVQFDPPTSPPSDSDSGEGGEAGATPQKPFQLLPVAEVVLEPGQTTTVEIKVERNGQQGPIQLALEGLPGGIEAPMMEIPEGQDSVKVELPVPAELAMIDEGAAEPTEPAESTETSEQGQANSIKLTATLNEATSEQQIKFKLAKPKPPEFSPIAGFTLKPGAAKEIEIKVNRRGFEGPIALAVAGLPAKVTIKSKPADGSEDGSSPSEDNPPGEEPAAPDEAQAVGDAEGESPEEGAAGAPVAEIPEGAASIKLVVAAARDAKDGKADIMITSTVRDQKIQAQFPLVIESFAVRLGSLPVVTLKPGETKTIDVPVVRRSYQGALKLEPTNVPAKISIAAIEIPAEAAAAKLEVSAAADAPELVQSAYLTGKASDDELKEALVVRVSKGEGGFLPKEVTADPEMARLLRRGAYGQRMEVETKQALLKAYGGTEESEAAVLLGLKWLAKQQNKQDGSWSLGGSGDAVGDGAGTDGDQQPANEAAAPAQNDGGAESSQGGVAGTALALLPFLGAGVTHEHVPAEPAELKEYQDVVLKGLTWLGGQMRANDPKTKGQLPGGTVAHAIGTMTLCEAYGMSQDSRIRRAAEAALQYLVKAQHSDGGWRVGEGPSSDLLTTRWALLAIRSGQLAGMSTDRTALAKAGKFLDSCGVGETGGKLAAYSAQPDGKATPAHTAAGLLSREFLGWEKEKPELLAGCQLLLENLPAEGSSARAGLPLYYYFDATQVLHHLEGEEWDKWNHPMREHLIARQQGNGNLEGSWNPGETSVGIRGGRLDSTVLALLTLECYYRQMPLYRKATR